MAITDWPSDERPREKLLIQGAESLSDSELLAIFLRTGSKGKTSVDLARDLLCKYNNLRSLLDTDVNSFCNNYGMGTAKFVQFQAALEVGKRYLKQTLQNGETINSSEQTKAFLSSALRKYNHEVFACLFLNTQHQLISFEILFHGTINESVVYPREIVKKCLKHNAAAIIFAHNHPSGSSTPSKDDIALTKKLSTALAVLDIQVLDHMIIGEGELVGLAELNLL